MEDLGRTPDSVVCEINDNGARSFKSLEHHRVTSTVTEGLMTSAVNRRLVHWDYSIVHNMAVNLHDQFMSNMAIGHKSIV